MPSFTCVNSVSDIPTGNGWLETGEFRKFCSAGRLVHPEGKSEGHAFRIVSKQTKQLSLIERVGKMALGLLCTIAYIFSAGQAFYFEKVEDLFIQTRKSRRFAVPDNHLSKLLESGELPKLSSTVLDALFPTEDGRHEESRKQFVGIKKESIRQAMEEGRISSQLKGLLSDDHLSAISLKYLESDDINRLFPRASSAQLKESRQRFSSYSSEEVLHVIERDVLSASQVALISDEQFRGMRLSGMNNSYVGDKLFPSTSDPRTSPSLEEQRRVLNLYSEAEILQAYDQQGFDVPNAARLPSDEMLKKIGLVNLSEQAMQNAWSFGSCSDEDRRRFALFTSEQLQEAMERGHLFDGQFELITDEQVQGIDFTKVPVPLTLKMRKYEWKYMVDPEYSRRLSPRQKEIIDGILLLYGCPAEDALPGSSNEDETKESRTDICNKLDISIDSSEDEISKAFRQAAFKYHPDKNPRAEGEAEEAYQFRQKEAEAKLQEISGAYTKYQRNLENQ